MTTIVLADDHKIVRQGVRALLEGEPQFKVVGEASGGQEAVRLVQSLKPDVLVTDLMMGDISGIEVAKRVKAGSPKTAVIILSMYGSEPYVAAALQAGATGYVLKGSGLEDLVSAIREVSSGRLYLGSPLSEKDIEDYRQRLKPTVDN